MKRALDFWIPVGIDRDEGTLSEAWRMMERVRKGEDRGFRGESNDVM